MTKKDFSFNKNCKKNICKNIEENNFAQDDFFNEEFILNKNKNCLKKISAIIFHPNTEQNFIKIKNDFLKNYDNFFPVFPMIGIFTNEKFSKLQKNNFKNLTKCFVNEIVKIDFIICLKGKFISENESNVESNNKLPRNARNDEVVENNGLPSNARNNVPFFVPIAIEKNCDKKDLCSIFSSATSALKNIKSQESSNLKGKIKKSQNQFCDSDFSFNDFCKIEFNFNQINFRTFQIADFEISKNQYKSFENFWLKIK